MTILCGTDFSEPARHALVVAARLAARMQTPLHVLHCAHTGESNLEYRAWAQRQLDRKAEQARALGADVRLHLEQGSPDDALIALAPKLDAQLIVIGPLGGRAPGTFHVGSHADRVAQRSHIPVLIVRDEEPFLAWLQGSRTLRIALGADFSRSTDAAMEAVGRLRRLSPCDVTAIHLYWPPQQFERMGLSGVRSYLEPDPDVTKTLVRDLSHRLASPDEPGSVHVHVEPHLGRIGDRLAELAFQREADLLVVGSHARSAAARLWEGTVSRWALHTARTSVLCVPAPATAPSVEIPRLRNVVAATDFSAAGNAAVGLAYAMCEPTGTVHIVHVLPAGDGSRIKPHDVFALEREGGADPRAEPAHIALAALVPRDRRDRMTRIYALESDDAAAAIRQAAVRLEADAICVGRRGRSNVANALLGSVSENVLQHAERPVLLAQAPRE
ncbi:MAG TPA: universal stress protein [Polyangiales bacterium]|nr:universal stress protein [Polyangiales bacterium]